MSGISHSNEHIVDAATAAVAFMENQGNLATVNAIDVPRSLSTIAAAALWSGWIDDVRELHARVLTIKRKGMYAGEVARLP